ncbi:hypothetical protein ANCDUO_16561 [Ancylostoma duodenale]|uniref:Tc1-like transposase DDE domain-containing protein n=1 Tax=Ancylostoma duodenale TaxID=51022 RepID=A0A0C2G337_9BILA|nr:hypothetical protein ANCDUO_16561 [Ancylostoma duodenale]
MEIVKNHLLPWATEHYENGHWILQQDGAPAHLANSTQYWCLANLPDASEWPANSPELNVLDFSISAMLEQKACQKKNTSVQALTKCLEKARNEIPQDHVRAALERLSSVSKEATSNDLLLSNHHLLYFVALPSLYFPELLTFN